MIIRVIFYPGIKEQKMPHFSSTSKRRLATCHPDLQYIMNKLIEIYDVTIVCGHRPEDEQNKAYDEGKSQLRWPQSKHNSNPSLAVDVGPYSSELHNIDWENENAFHYMAGLIIGIADASGINLKWGGHWKSFKDMPHFELA
jgi:peptidoglycan L-alanyl-D-glutamate endopeptidase CwlK